MTLARQRGFRILLRYFILSSPQLNVERVRLRVSSGGHDVPHEKIIDRYWRSLAQLPWFIEAADSVLVYDNSGSEPKRVSWKEGGEMVLTEDAPDNLRKAFEASAV